MREPIQHRGRHLGVGEDLGPVGEGEIGGDDDRGVLVELADQVEEQLRASLAEGQIAELVDDDEILAQQGFDDASALAGGLLLFELIDQVDEVEETAAGARSDDGGGDRDGVFADSGVRRGADIARFLALGARGVMIGRATLYGVAMGGTGGASRVLDLLSAELQTTMGMLGAQKLADIQRVEPSL